MPQEKEVYAKKASQGNISEEEKEKNTRDMEREEETDRWQTGGTWISRTQEETLEEALP